MCYRSYLFGPLGQLLCIALLTLTGTSAAISAEELSAVFLPQLAPAPSSVSVSMSAPLIGAVTDDSSLSGDATLVVGQSDEPFGFGQLVDMQLVMDDGMDFSLLNGALVANAAPGAASVRMVEPGPAGDVVDGKFDQLENIFQFEGEIFLSTEDGPFDLSTVPPIEADLLDIQLTNQGNQLSAAFTIDLNFVAAVTTPIGQVPLSIQIQGRLEAIAALTLIGDFDDNGQLDADDIDLLHQAIRTQSIDPQFDLNGDDALDEADSRAMVLDVMGTYYGDANLDGGFGASDLVQVLARGQFEDSVLLNSGWRDGDWSGDGEFTTGDLVLAIQSGCFESCAAPKQATASVPEPTAIQLAWTAILMLRGLSRRRVR